MRTVLEEAAELTRTGQPFALATVVWRQGPSSSQQGSHAIITADGEVHGWIGGACAEPAVLREAAQAIADGTARLLLLGTPDEVAKHVPVEGLTLVPIACQSEGAVEVFIEPVLPAPHLVIVGDSPMAHTLASLAQVLGWRAEVAAGTDFAADERSMVVVATQGHDDEGVLERAVAARPAYLGLVGSRKRGTAVLGYLADRGVPAEQLDRVRVPAGLNLGRTSHTEIAVAILAELVQLRARGATAVPPTAIAEDAVDPVCGMTVSPGTGTPSLTRSGDTYYFCGAACHRAFEKDPTGYAKARTL